jgi:DNA repair ATPase RecN
MAKEIAFSIKFLGNDKVVNTIEQLEKSLKAANAELKKTEIGSDAYNELSQDVAKTSFELNKLRKEQQEANKAFQASKEAVGSVNALSKELRDLRRQYDALSKADREGEIGKQLSANINKLDKELKGIDFSIGRYFRNIGNYLSALSKGTGSLSKKIGGLAGATTGLANVPYRGRLL